MKIKNYILFFCASVLLSGCVVSDQRSVVQDASGGDGSMQVIGQAEYVTVHPAGLRYRARIDSGATTCSMSALDIEQFERDGEKWVRFKLPLPKESPEGPLKKSEAIEYPVTRIANIKRHGAEDQIRPAVKMEVELGQFRGRVEFTLTDRTKYEFPILVGRNLLEGNVLVDVSKSYVAEVE